MNKTAQRSRVKEKSEKKVAERLWKKEKGKMQIKGSTKYKT